MASEHVALIQRAWEAWLAGDMEGLLACYSEDVIWDLTHFRQWPDQRYERPAGVRQFLSEWLDLWDEFEAGVEQVREAPDGRVVSLAWQRGKGRHSGLRMDMEWAVISTVREGKIIRMDNYDDRGEALDAVGLGEGD